MSPSGDMFTQTAMATPMIGLYLFSIILAWAFGKKTRKDDAEDESFDGGSVGPA
jgi:Sec-independent protein secretion pathway component TatC